MDLSVRVVKMEVKYRAAFIPALYDSHIQELSFSAESFVFQSAIQKFKDEDTQNYNFACCCVWV